MPLYQINKKLLPIKIHFFLVMAGTAPILPFLSTISKQRGYSPVIVGLIFTILPLPGLLVRPVIGAITDKYKCRKTAFVLNTVLRSLLINILIFIPGSVVRAELNDTDVIKSPIFWLFVCTVTLYKVDSMTGTVLEDTICIDILGENKTEYGNQRMWGSIGWGIMSIVSGVCVDWYSKGLDHKNYTPGFIISLICSILDIYVVSSMPYVQNREVKAGSNDIKRVLTNIRVQSFLLFVLAFGTLLPFIWYYLFWYMEDISNIYHPETKPYIKTIQGFSLTIQCLGGEVPFFFLSNFILKRIGHTNVFSLMFFAYAVRFYLYSIITNPVWVLPVELLNGITYALAYAAAISYAAELAPVGAEGTLQGIVGTTMEEIGHKQMILL
ncbi:major facilitator superfamily domain-containing protein 6-B-like isoform X2 [Myzus persicae]|uniref:major facilitator superfamily domain-containing protein 6-B-like isoform X2 n=1 Tax=Myzus persicae TaxID=13164 RepID=UPI000B93533C|nr:major facilitator superfamily domain-containing protein 6-B-like isoform X2 [Myzus persicae]